MGFFYKTKAYHFFSKKGFHENQTNMCTNMSACSIHNLCKHMIPHIIFPLCLTDLSVAMETLYMVSEMFSLALLKQILFENSFEYSGEVFALAIRLFWLV